MRRKRATPTPQTLTTQDESDNDFMSTVEGDIYDGPTLSDFFDSDEASASGGIY